MDKFLKPERFNNDPNSPTAQTEWKHWYSTFESFLGDIKGIKEEGKLKLLINHISPQNFIIIQECDTCDAAINNLKAAFAKPTNEIFARHQLATRVQAPNESINQYFRSLQQLSQECDFKAVTAQQNKEKHMTRD